MKRYLDNQVDRDDFVAGVIRDLPNGAALLDAGAGSQRYRKICSNLIYSAQDFGDYSSDEKASLAGGKASANRNAYAYGQIDIRSDIWSMPVDDAAFDAVLCTEVLEHVPYPIATVRELSRVLKPGGVLILTAPSNCLRHFDPYFYTSGFSDRWFERILTENGLKIEELEPVGDYYRWIAVELARTARRGGFFAAVSTLPSFLYFATKRPSKVSVDTLCMGYHVLARKLE